MALELSGLVWLGVAWLLSLVWSGLNDFALAFDLVWL